MSLIGRVSTSVASTLDSVDDVFKVIGATTNVLSKRVETYSKAETVTSANRLTNMVANTNQEFVDEQFARIKRINDKLELGKTISEIYIEAENMFLESK